MKYIGLGNEQWGEFYYERLKPFVKAIREKYPDIKIVGSSGPMPDDDANATYRFADGWKAMRELKADLVDEHFYRDEEWFLTHTIATTARARKSLPASMPVTERGKNGTTMRPRLWKPPL